MSADTTDDRPHGVPTELPCPSWCELDTGHPLAPSDDPELVEQHQASDQAADKLAAHRLFRVHQRRYGDRATHVVAEAWERALTPAGPTDLGTDPEATLVRLQLPTGHGYLTPAGARRLAELLTRAADELDQHDHQNGDDLA